MGLNCVIKDILQKLKLYFLQEKKKEEFDVRDTMSEPRVESG